MTPDNYVVVFNIAENPFTGWTEGIFGLVFVIIGLGMLALGEGKVVKSAGIAMALFALLGSSLAVRSLWKEYEQLQRSFREGDFNQVEGYVVDFETAPLGDHGPQRFAVAGHQFEIFQASSTSAFHATTRAGGPAIAGGCARVLFTNDNKIIWLGLRRSCVAETSLDQAN